MLNALIALTALSLAATPALADTGSRRQSAPTARVSHADLDLSRPADRKILDRRIAASAERLCPPLLRTGQITPSDIAVRCRAETTARARPQRSAAVVQASATTVTAGSR